MKKGFIESALMAAIAVTLVLAGVFAASFIKDPPTKSEAWAAWVQAIGSVLGIFSAVGIAWWQGYQQRLDRQRQLKEEADSRALQFHLICLALANALHHLQKRIEAARPSNVEQKDVVEIDEVAGMLRDLQFAKLDQWVLSRVFVIRGIISNLRTRLTRMSNSPEMNGLWREDIMWIKELEGDVRNVILMNGKTLVERGIREPDSGKP